jgi:hypothetical protein
MIYDEFASKIVSIDKTNCFLKSKISNNHYNKFYDLYDTKCVEFEYNDGIIFMIPYKQIAKITKEYSYI